MTPWCNRPVHPALYYNLPNIWENSRHDNVRNELLSSYGNFEIYLVFSVVVFENRRLDNSFHPLKLVKSLLST